MNESNLARGLFGAKPKKSGRKGAKADSQSLPGEVEKPVTESSPDAFSEYSPGWAEPAIGRQTPKKSAKVKPKLDGEFSSKSKPKSKQSEEQWLQVHDEEMIKSLEEQVKSLKLQLAQKQEVERQLRQQNQQLQLDLETREASLRILQRSLQEVTSQLDQPSERVIALEAQVAELQEQVLKQAGQTAEYEAAIQHWKEQSLHHQRHALQLSGALERLMDEQKSGKRPTKLEKELALGNLAATEPEEVKPSGKVNLPSFLMRQHPALS